jgi:hypothetical protein
LTAWASSELYESSRAAAARTADGRSYLNASIPVDPSSYAETNASLVLTLRLAELKPSTQPSQRRFDVYVNGLLAVPTVDVAEVAAWRDSSSAASAARSSGGNATDVATPRLHDLHIQLDVEHAGWFIRVAGRPGYAGFFGELNVSLMGVEGASLMPQLFALLLTTGSIEDAPQTKPPGYPQVQPDATELNEGQSWFSLGNTIVAIVLASVLQIVRQAQNEKANTARQSTAKRNAKRRKQALEASRKSR